MHLLAISHDLESALTDPLKPETYVVQTQLPARVETVQLIPGEFRVPDNTVDQAVTGFLTLGIFGGLLDLTFVSVGAYIQPDGTLKNQAAVTSRSRLNLETVRRLRDALDETITSLTTQPADEVN